MRRFSTPAESSTFIENPKAHTTRSGQEYRIGVASPTTEVAVATRGLLHEVWTDRYVGFPDITGAQRTVEIGHISATLPNAAKNVEHYRKEHLATGATLLAEMAVGEEVRVVGMIELVRGDIFGKNRQPFEVPKIDEVNVHPTMQGKGIGSQLILHALEKARVEQPADPVVGLEFIHGNPARQFYERAGFIATGGVRDLQIFGGHDSPTLRWVSMVGHTDEVVARLRAVTQNS